jgi:hypothetical protein
MFESKDTLTYDDYCEFMAREHQYLSEKFIYHVAIIDYLQVWNLNKKGERVLKQMIGKDGDKISVCEPFMYANRFRQFVET